MFAKILCVLLVQLFLSLPSFAQTPNQFGTTILKTADGYLIVDNKEKVSYRIEFKGKKLVPMETDHPVFELDGKLIQVVSVAISNFYQAKPGDISKPRETELLEKHQVWESDYIGEQLKSKLTVSKEFIELNSKKIALLWTFNMPKEFDSQFASQMFLTTKIAENVLGLNASLEAKDNAIESRKYLLEAINTLQISLKPFDLSKISEELKKGR